MTPFYDKWKKYDISSDVNDDWDEVEMAPTPYTSKETGHTTHKCNSEHPTECSCSYICCSKPCRYYSDNGYQFPILYKILGDKQYVSKDSLFYYVYLNDNLSVFRRKKYCQ